MSDENENEVIDFDDLDDDFNEAPDSDEIPNGDYSCVIVKCHPARNKAGDKRMMKLRLKILGPRCVGRVLFMNWMMEKDNIGRTKQDIKRLEIPIERLSQLNDAEWVTEHIVGRKAECKVQKNGDFLNTYINKFLGIADMESGDGMEVGAGGSADDDDDIDGMPF